MFDILRGLEKVWADCKLLIGYSDYQVYLMLSCAPIQGHVGGLVDVSTAA